MKTSRSKKSGLSTMIEDGNGDTRSIDTSSKSSGGFTSFFGRSKRSKSPNPNSLSIESPHREHATTVTKQNVRRNSLNSRHYKTLSRSMNDLGTMLSGIELREPLHSKLNNVPQVSPRKSLEASVSSPQSSPTKRKTTKKEASTPFPATTITTQGWLNKRGSKKENNMKLYRVYLRESKLYAYKPPAEVAIRAFDLTTPELAKFVSPTESVAPDKEVIQFAADTQSILYDVTKPTETTRIHHTQMVQEVLDESELQSNRDLSRLVFVTDLCLVVCKKGSHETTSSGDVWCLDLKVKWASVQFDFYESEHPPLLVIRYEGITKSFTDNSVDGLRELLNHCRTRRTANAAQESDSDVLGASDPALDLPASDLGQDAPVSQELFSIRQIVRNDQGKIVRGTVAGLCRQILLEKVNSVEARTLSSILLSTIGLWASAEEILQELCAQLNILAESATRNRPAYIVRALIGTAASLLLDSKNVEGLLKLIGFASITEQDSLREELWATRTKLLAIITMDLSHQSVAESNLPNPDWTAQFQSLSQDGLQADSILAIPANLFAAQLHVFHTYYLKRWDPAQDQALFFNTASKGASRNPLIFESRRMHFLTYTILNHVLSLDAPPISTAQRAAIITQWILIGMMLKRLGDMAGWLAAVMAICAPAIVRLKEMWSMIEDRLQLVVEKEWSPVMRDLFRRTIDKSAHHNSAHVLAPDVDGLSVSSPSIVPFYGDLCNAIEETRRKVVDEAHASNASVDIEALQSGEDLLNTALESYRLFVLEHNSEGSDDDSDRETAIPVFQDCFKQLNSVPSEILDVCSPSLLAASLKCEAGRRNSLTKCHISDLIDLPRSTSVPLLFTDLLPGFRLFEASILLDIHDPLKRSRLQDYPTNPGTNLRRLNSFPPSQQPSSYTDIHNYLDQATRARAAASVSQWKVLKHVKDLAGVSDKLIHFVSGNLILKDLADVDESNVRRRPQSVLVEERKRSSTISRRSSLQMPDPAVFEADEDLVIKPSRHSPKKSGIREVVIKAATINTLIDLLIFDIRDLRYLEVVTTLTNDQTKASNFELDRPDYLKIFLVSHRSYCSSTSLMEALYHRLSKALLVSSTDKSEFPNWDVDANQTTIDETLDWQLIEKTYTGIYEVVSSWLNIAPADFTGSPEMLKRLDDFLTLSRAQLAKLKHLEEVTHSSSACRELCSSHLRRMSKQILRVHHRPQSWPITHYDEQRLEIYEPLSIGRFSDSEHIHMGIKQLDSIVESVLQCITLEDWMQCYELFEAQKSNDSGFLGRVVESIPLETEVRFQTVLDLLHSTASGNSTSTIHDNMPLPVRRLIQLRHNITSWTIQQVADPELAIETRVLNMELFLRLLSTSKLCMSPLDIKVSTGQLTTTQTIPAFIAGAVATGLLSPESRMYYQSWHVVAQNAGHPNACGSLTDLIPVTESTESHVPLVPCLAWLLERMLEVACYIPDVSPEDANLLNFDKRRYIYNLLSNLDLVSLNQGKTSILDEIDNPFLFVLSPPADPLDRRAVRLAASKESQMQRGTKSMKAFSELVHLELEKVRREMRHKDLVEKLGRDARKLAQRRLQEASRVEITKRPASRARYGMNSLLRAVRPLSVAISGNWTAERTNSLARVVSPRDLPANCSISRGTRPALTIDLVHSTCHVSDLEGHIFNIGTEDGMHTYFQAPSHEQMEHWMQEILNASKDGARKRRTMIREDAHLALNEESPQFSPRNSLVKDIVSATFGVELGILVRRDGASIPRIATILMDEIEKRALLEVGIYRISGSLSTVNALKRALDSGQVVDLSDSPWNDVNAIAGVFKLWLRELPEPLMTYKLYDQFLATLEIQDYSAKFLALKELVHQLPVPNFSMLKRLIEHLEKITDYETTNHMYAHNLAIIFGPNILQPVPSTISFAASMNDLGKVQTIIRNIILQCHWIFSTEDDTEELAPALVSAAVATTLTIIEEDDIDLGVE